MKGIKKIFRIYEEKPKISSLKIVFTNGCFDILHPGHLKYLKEASFLGDVLVIGLNSDKSISLLKGKNRPINDFDFRATMLSYLDFVDYIIEFDDIDPINLIKSVNPHFLVKGSDYINKEISGSEHVVSNGGEVILINFLEGYSSTRQIQKIRDNW
jgi:D-beta-D-heptose 7-phosphate kinase/D-beta-D-heptose 1-phosphate adenosyltransferase